MIKSDILNPLITCIKSNIKDKNIDTSSCFKIIILSIENMEKYNELSGDEKKKYIIQAIEIIAKGNDNISGTNDDVIDDETLLSLIFILNKNYLSDFIDLIFKASNGEININKIKKKCCIF
jgi:hypothetical protein